MKNVNDKQVTNCKKSNENYYSEITNTVTIYKSNSYISTSF